jgi:two-component system, OmpR family, response regulator VicR
LLEHILLVEDDLTINEMVRDYLTKESYKVTCAWDGKKALQLFMEHRFDLVMLDLMIPHLNGMELLERIRLTSTVPVLIISAKDGESDKAVGLGCGADDYVAKPFSLIELTARVRAAIRRAKKYSGHTNQPETELLSFRGITMDVTNYTVSKNGETMKLTSKEFSILKLFLSHPKRVYTKEKIYELVWQEEYYGDENIINVHIRRLREKIEDDPSTPSAIVTVWGIGYKLGES